MPIFTLHLGQYQITTEPDHKAKLRAVLHQYEGRADKKRDGFVFCSPTHKRDALLGIVKIL